MVSARCSVTPPHGPEWSVRHGPEPAPTSPDMETCYEIRCPECGSIDVRMYGSAQVSTWALRRIDRPDAQSLTPSYVNIEGDFRLHKCHCNWCGHVYNGDPDISAANQLDEAGILVPSNKDKCLSMLFRFDAVKAFKSGFVLRMDGTEVRCSSVEYSLALDIVSAVSHGVTYQIAGASVKADLGTGILCTMRDRVHVRRAKHAVRDGEYAVVDTSEPPAVYSMIEIETE